MLFEVDISVVKPEGGLDLRHQETDEKGLEDFLDTLDGGKNIAVADKITITRTR